jgi:hypothetical protein
VQSLEDTPEVYQVKQTKDVPLRKDIRRYLSSRERRDIIEDPDYTLANINEKIAAGDLQFLGIFELYLNTRFTFESEELSINTFTSEKRPGSTPANRVSNNRKSQRSPSANVPKLASASCNSSVLDLYRQAILSKLNDSVIIPSKPLPGSCTDFSQLVDIGAKYRILFVQSFIQ